jgi:hypothetical protein
VFTRIFSRPYLLSGSILMIVLAVPVFQRDRDWVRVYLPAAARLANGADIYQEETGFVYPPINALLALPFRALPRVPSLMLWHALNMAALMILILGAWKLSGGGRLDGMPRIPWREHAIFWLGLGCGISSCLDAITNQQTDLIVAALVILGCLALVQQRDLRAFPSPSAKRGVAHILAWRSGSDLRAALWFGGAAAIKCTPLIWAGYLAWRRRWAAALLVVAVAGAVNLLPDLTDPPTNASTRFGDWTRRFLFPMATSKHDFGSWACGIGGNQSVPGLAQRWLVYDAVWQGDELDGVAKEVRATPQTLKAVSWSAMLALLAAALVCAWRTPAGAESLREPGPSASALHFGLVLMLMVLLSPHSSKPHFCTLVLPGFCVARAALAGANRRLLRVLGAALVLALSANEDLVGEWLFSWTKWYGALAWSALLLYAASCSILLIEPRGARGLVTATSRGSTEEYARI